MSSIHQSAEQAVDAIIALINSRVQSPTKAELLSIVAGVSSPAAPPSPDPVGRLSELRAVIREVETAHEAHDGSDGADDRVEAANRRFDELTNRALVTAPRTLLDLQERALIARYWFQHGKCVAEDGKESPGPWINPADLDDFGERCVAELFHAVLGFDGELPASTPPLDPNIYLVDPKDRDLVAWDEIVARYLQDTQRVVEDADADRLDKDFSAAAKAIWGRPVLTWRDVVLRAVVAVHWNTNPAALLARVADTRLHMDDQSLANLVRAILDLSGLHLDTDGRVVPPPSGETPWVRVGTSRSFVRSLD